ncbi:IclR family transcriptional regulator [Microbacterium sp. BWT-B31]|uniref:IclR family transcriptional regulator n=1 Tax=Microbacterium sp. BWT-B31 TaxID=3232072 RepID=UPI00352904F4
MTDVAGVAPVESVDRALILLEALHDGEILGVSDAAARLDVAPSTAHRLLASLVFRGFAVQDRDRRYRLGPALAARPAEPLTLSTLRAHAHPVLERLHEQTGETVQLMVLHRRNIRFIDGIECELPLRVGVRVGDEMPAHCSAGGKALLAALSSADLDALYQQGLPPWPTAKYSDLPSLKRHLARVRAAGHGANHEETEQGVSGLGVAVLDDLRRPVAAITVAVPSARFATRSATSLREPLAAAVAELQERMQRPPTD